MIRPKDETEHLLLSFTKNCGRPINETHRKSEATLEFKITKPEETFHFKPPISIEGSWMVGLTSLEVCNSIFSITEGNNKFALYKNLDSKNGGVSFEKVRDEIEKYLESPDFTATDWQDEILGPIIIEENRKEVQKESKMTNIWKF